MSESLTMHRPRTVLHKSPAFEFVGGGFHEAPAGKDFPLHYHPHGWEAVYYRSGFITCVHGDDSFTSEPGLLWLTPPGVEHAELAHTAYSNTFFEFRAPASASFPRTVLDDERQNLGRLCAEIVIERTDREISPLADLLLQELFLRIERLADRQQTHATTQVVRRAEVLIASSLNHRPKIQDIAEKSGVSVSGLRAAFQTVRGKSPLTVLREIRCQRTISMLHNSTQTLEALSELCGYDSASHLSREIKRSTGKSPGKIRQLVNA
jgi:AraC-like DNA-binding protein